MYGWAAAVASISRTRWDQSCCGDSDANAHARLTIAIGVRFSNRHTICAMADMTSDPAHLSLTNAHARLATRTGWSKCCVPVIITGHVGAHVNLQPGAHAPVQDATVWTVARCHRRDQGTIARLFPVPCEDGSIRKVQIVLREGEMCDIFNHFFVCQY